VLGLAWAWGHTWGLGAAAHRRRAPRGHARAAGVLGRRPVHGRGPLVHCPTAFIFSCCVNACKPLILLVWYGLRAAPRVLAATEFSLSRIVMALLVTAIHVFLASNAGRG
jgi:hypothetical protein